MPQWEEHQIFQSQATITHALTPEVGRATALPTSGEAQSFAAPTQTSTPSAEYKDAFLCFAVTVPLGWTYVDGNPGAFADFGPVDKPLFNITNVSFRDTPTLELAVSELRRGSLGPSIQSVENWVMDGVPAMLATLGSEAEFKFVTMVIPPDCGDAKHALFISAVDSDRAAFEIFLKRIRFIK